MSPAGRPQPQGQGAGVVLIDGALDVTALQPVPWTEECVDLAGDMRSPSSCRACESTPGDRLRDCSKPTTQDRRASVVAGDVAAAPGRVLAMARLRHSNLVQASLQAQQVLTMWRAPPDMAGLHDWEARDKLPLAKHTGWRIL